jgi:UDP-2,4-diacetamido-2,4,6-trideoxy-beta-L-altropyranose hydrolase
MKKTLLIRADAGVAMGTGHVMRMIALAQAWLASGGEVIFLCSEITPSLEQRIREEDLQLEKIIATPGSKADCEATTAVVSGHAKGDRSLVVALDGYQFGSDFQLGIKKTHCPLLVVDDYGHAGGYHADFVLNQNVSAREELYAKCDKTTQLLLGPRFALLRREFADHRGWTRNIPEQATKLLVTLGGADADNVTKKVIGAIRGAGLEVKVVVGGSNPHLSSLRQAAEAATTGGTRVELVVNSSGMPGLMQWADVAVAAGGSTSWELAFTGLPSLFIILAENQQENALELERQGFGLCIGRYLDFDADAFRSAINRLARDAALRTGFAARGRDMVDGLGAHRVAALLEAEIDLKLRCVIEADFQLLWEWANDTATRANSFDSAPIPWDHHKVWCHTKLRDPECRLWIASTSEIGKIGVVRFDGHDSEATISITLAPQARGKGYAKRIIRSACERMFALSRVALIRALIKPENKASVRAFESAGFLQNAGTTVKGQPAEQYLLHRTS